MGRRRFSINAWPASGEVDLLRVLDALGRDEVMSRQWILDEGDPELAGTPDAAEELFDAAKNGTAMSGTQLLDLASRRVQIIDGTLIGRDAGGAGDEVVVQAIDSTYWLVEGSEQSLAPFLRVFPDARDESTFL